MKNKILLILASVLVFSLALTGCSGGDEDTENETSESEARKGLCCKQT